MDYWEWYRERIHQAQKERAERKEQDHYDEQFSLIVQGLTA